MFYIIILLRSIVEEDKENSGTVENTDDEETDQKQDTEAVNVIRSNNSIQNYRYDKKKHLWCELTFSVSFYKYMIYVKI